jgi:DNA helicase-2/ATP-dependent DNA helicase PcrA
MFLEEISLMTDVDQLDDQEDRVVLMTLHSAKGLEFDNVFMVGVEEGLFPGMQSMGNPEDIEEERRLMYVAVTRAEKRLFLTESEGYSVQGGFNKVPSRFLREIKEHLMVTEGHMDEDLWNRAAIFSRAMDAECGLAFIAPRNEFLEGDEVIHDHFGNGIIRNIYDDGEYCEVEFWESGLRSLKTEKLRKA